AAFKCERLAELGACDEILTPTERENLAAGDFTDWVDLATRDGFQQQHNLSVSGGASDGVRYYLSASALDVQGIAENDDFQRYGVRLNLDSQLKPWLQVGTSTNLSY